MTRSRAGIPKGETFRITAASVDREVRRDVIRCAGGQHWLMAEPDTSHGRGRWLLSWLCPPAPCSQAPDEEGVHAWAAFVQCDLLAELDLLQLGDSLRTAALERGCYDKKSFDVMVTIADLLVAEHDWSLQQSDGWLERMGLWHDD